MLCLRQLLCNSAKQEDCNFKVSRMGDYKTEPVVTCLWSHTYFPFLAFILSLDIFVILLSIPLLIGDFAPEICCFM